MGRQGKQIRVAIENMQWEMR